jgi:hypothetical protein
MKTIDAFHLPGVEEELQRWEFREYDGGAVRLRVPHLEPATLERLLERLRAARARHLQHRPVREIVRSIDRAAALFLEPAGPIRSLAEDALPAITGYSPAMIRLILDRMAADWRGPALAGLLRAELGDPELLDGFRARPAVAGAADPGVADMGAVDAGAAVLVRALGPELAFQIFAGNVPGVAVTSLVRALLVKGATLGKTAAGEPLLAALFARALARVDPGLGECLAVTYWPGGAEPLEEAALRGSDLVIVYGGGAVVDSVRRRLPTGVRLVEHGPRLSLALVARESLSAAGAARTAAELARATATFDQQGCVSPHVAYVERGGEVTPEEFATQVAAALERLEGELPRGRLTAAEAATIHQVRGAAEFRAIAGRPVRILASTGTEYTVIYDEEPAFTPSCLNRVLRITPLGELEDVVRHLAPFGRYLQTVGVAASPGRRAALAEPLGRLGASRITTLEATPWPPPAWHHDGQEPLRELLRWVDLEG